jgi:ubiquinone/menaquinone biosynthesis C-methylase UbiE
MTGWPVDVIDNDDVTVVDETPGLAPLLVARDLPLDAATAADEAYHDREASGYDGYSTIPRVAAAEDWIVSWIRRQTLPGMTVDLGCGTGRVIRALAGGGRTVIGVDRSATMLGVARRQVPSSDVVLLRGDVRRLPLHDRSVSSVVCSGVLHHVPAWREAVQEAARVLRPGGRLIVREPNAAYPASLFEPFERALARLARWLPQPSDAVAADMTEAGESLSPVERPIPPVELIDAAQQAGFGVTLTGSAMLFGSLGVPDTVPNQQLYFGPANLLDRLLLELTHHRAGALLLGVFTVLPAPPTCSPPA